MSASTSYLITDDSIVLTYKWQNSLAISVRQSTNLRPADAEQADVSLVAATRLKSYLGKVLKKNYTISTREMTNADYSFVPKHRGTDYQRLVNWGSCMRSKRGKKRSTCRGSTRN